MDVHIAQMNSQVDAVDPESLLTPAMLDRIVAAVTARIDDGRRREQATADDRTMRTGLTSGPWLDGGTGCHAGGTR